MIRIVTDSTCEGPAELLHHPAVTVVPLSVVFGQESYRDGVEISIDEFWARLPKSRTLPTTAQAAPGDFLEPFRRFTDSGDEVVAILLSSKLSGTYDSAVSAKNELPGRRIDVIDSLSVSVGLGLMVQKAVEMAEAGAARGQIVARLLEMRERIPVLFVLETLEYLQRGGRIGRAQAFMGTLLQFKPLLSVRDGEVYPVNRVRSKRKALDTMLETLAREIPERGPKVHLAVMQACVPEEADQVAAQLSQLFQSPHIFVGVLGPVLGVHTGPGVIGAAAFADDTAEL